MIEISKIVILLTSGMDICQLYLAGVTQATLYPDGNYVSIQIKKDGALSWIKSNRQFDGVPVEIVDARGVSK